MCNLLRWLATIDNAELEHKIIRQNEILIDSIWDCLCELAKWNNPHERLDLESPNDRKLLGKPLQPHPRQEVNQSVEKLR